MGVLDRVFGGGGGLVNMLADLLGGECRLTYVHEQTYDETTHRDVTDETYQVLPFIPAENDVSSGTVSALGGLLAGRNQSEQELIRSEKRCVGTIPSANMVRSPIAGRDRFDHLRKTYRIVHVKENTVGDTVVSYTVTGVQV